MRTNIKGPNKGPPSIYIYIYFPAVYGAYRNQRYREGKWSEQLSLDSITGDGSLPRNVDTF